MKKHIKNGHKNYWLGIINSHNRCIIYLDTYMYKIDRCTIDSKLPQYVTSNKLKFREIPPNP